MNVYGIGNCDTCRKARRWLEGQGIAFRWIDVRETVPDQSRVRKWLAQAGPERLVNRHSATWRQLPTAQRPALDAPGLAALLVAHPTLIKRPVFERRDGIRVGFDAAVQDWLGGGPD